MNSLPIKRPSFRASRIQVDDDLTDHISRLAGTELPQSVVPLQDVELPGNPVALPAIGAAGRDGRGELPGEVDEGVLLISRHLKEDCSGRACGDQSPVGPNGCSSVNERVPGLKEPVVESA